ncbi:stabilin 1 [Saguinus oedipus]|uniref:Stabilin 1 n=1 Tax=Saguinus oedipus TaxID=9490 RepID=A0ABQ9U2G2_SAGOE|nr:stabilin 1 [Saguinus oedipus]
MSAVQRPSKGRACFKSQNRQGPFAPVFLPSLGLGPSVLSPLCSELPVCQELSCPQNTQCSAEAPSCRCLPGYTQQGGECQAPNPCWPSPCSPLAQCSVSPTGQAQCHCPENYHGDGMLCLPKDPCTDNLAGCPSNSTLCVYQKPGQASCVCRSGLVSINSNVSGGCQAFCSPYSCDRSATCQVTADGKTSCVCKQGEVGDGRACYGHLLHEVQKAMQTGRVFLQLRVAMAMMDQGCREILTTAGPFTVLVPSIPSSSSRTMNASLAQQLCRQHIIAGQHILEDTKTQQTRRWWTLAGQEISVAFNQFTVREEAQPGDKRSHSLARKYSYKYKDQPQQTFNIYKPNNVAANGIFHVVTALRWQPPSGISGNPKRTISQILTSTEAFSRFETILENCGLPSILDGPGPFTVFAPSNEAVDSLRDGRLIYLFTTVSSVEKGLRGLSKLQELVRYHIYNHGQLTIEKLISKGRILTMANQVLAVNISEEGRILLGPEGVPLQRVDLLASNGVIHMLDGILLPPTILPILPKHCSEEQHKIVVGSCVDCQALNTSTCPLNSVKLGSALGQGGGSEKQRLGDETRPGGSVLPSPTGLRGSSGPREQRTLDQGCLAKGLAQDLQLLTGFARPTQDILPKECVYIHDPSGLNVLKKGCASYCNQTIMVSLGPGAHSMVTLAPAAPQGPPSWGWVGGFLRGCTAA